MAKCAKYFQTQMAKHFIYIYCLHFFFVLLVVVVEIKNKQRSVLLTRCMRNRCLVLSCHKSGTSFRFLMILILVCRVFVGSRSFFFRSLSLYDSFVYDRNIHLTTSFRWAAARVLTSIADGDDSLHLFVRCIHSSQTLAMNQIGCAANGKNEENSREKNELTWRMQFACRSISRHEIFALHACATSASGKSRSHLLITISICKVAHN